MAADIRRIHHVGHLVTDMAVTLERYRQMGFEFAAPAYPMISPADGEPPRFLGATNTHLSFPDNFVELATVVPDGASPPAGAELVHVQIAPDALARVLDTARRTVATLAASLARFQGLHIVVFESDSITASAQRLDHEGVRHSGTNLVQRQLETLDGQNAVPVPVLGARWRTNNRRTTGHCRKPERRNPETSTLFESPKWRVRIDRVCAVRRG
jgi:catechol 2,3-dioxygenase-like lactoylglutathione lyase family enzyme